MSYYTMKLDSSSVDCIINRVADFVSKQANPNEYAQGNPPEDLLQKELSAYMSRWYDVLREVNVPNCNDNSKKWEIDESMKTQTSMGDTVFIIGELKQYAEGMADRDFVKAAKDDIDKVKKVTNKYYDTPLGLTLFISREKNDIDEIATYAKNNGFRVTQPEVNEEGYFAIITIIEPEGNRDNTAPQYSKAWKERLDNVIKDGTKEENFFHYQITKERN